MSREKSFEDMMESLFEMARYIALFDNKLYQYNEHRLYATEVYALNIIKSKENINMTQLAELTHRTKGAISQMIAKLERINLVCRDINPENKSEYLLRLLPEGYDVCELHSKSKIRIYDKYLKEMDDFTTEDFASTKEILSHIYNVTRSRLVFGEKKRRSDRVELKDGNR